MAPFLLTGPLSWLKWQWWVDFLIWQRYVSPEYRQICVPIPNTVVDTKYVSIKRHQNDATSVNLIVEELRNEPYDPVLIYKPQGRQEPQFPTLQNDTFVLALHTKFQRDLY